jgi:hypothetical protein
LATPRTPSVPKSRPTCDSSESESTTSTGPWARFQTRSRAVCKPHTRRVRTGRRRGRTTSARQVPARYPPQARLQRSGRPARAHATRRSPRSLHVSRGRAPYTGRLVRHGRNGNPPSHHPDRRTPRGHGFVPPGRCVSGVAGAAAQRLLYCVPLRAFFRPAFLRSTARASRVRKPAFLSAPRLLSTSASFSARATPRRSAPA